MRIYQGGAVPGRMIRVVNIPGVDVEACGGTHLNNTKEVGSIKILRTSKIQDGIVRIEFTAGETVGKISGEEKGIFDVVFSELNKLVEFDGKITDIPKQLRECSHFFSVPIKQLVKTTEKFVKEALEDSGLLNKRLKRVKAKTLKDGCEVVFKIWKSQKKELEKLRKGVAKSNIENLVKKAKNNRILEVVDMERRGMIKTADLLISSHPKFTVILVNKNGDVVGMSKTKDITKEIKEFCKKYKGSGGGKGFLAQGKIELSKFKNKE
jgi:alanyl-tRNA synthetase